MTDASPPFLLFAVVIAVLFNISGRPQWKQTVLLLASAVFLVLLPRSPLELLPLIAFTLIGFGFLAWIQSGRKASLAAFITIVVLLFVWLKKYTFVPSPMLLPFPYLALGLSYIVFRVLHLFIEASNGTLPAKVGIGQYLTYTLNFTTFVAGPIQRFADFDSMLRSEGRPASAAIVGSSLERAIRGLFKIRVLAFAFFSLHERAIVLTLTSPADWWGKSLAGATAFVSFTFFLYTNFSGYIDVVIAISWLLGISLPENFDRPFFSDSFIGFWSRWHMTLSAWLKDYVYLPLVSTLMRRFSDKSVDAYLGCVAYFATFFLVGVWHGQNAVFFFFGLLQGGGMAANKFFQVYGARRLGRPKFRRLSANGLWCAVCRGLTFTWFTFTLTWFWSDWRQIKALYSAMHPLLAVLCWAGIWFASTILLAGWEAIRAAVLQEPSRWDWFLFSRYSRTAWTTALLLVIVAMAALLDQPVPEIVYGKF